MLILIGGGRPRWSGEVENVIVIENKISDATDFTNRQKAAWKLIDQNGKLEVKVSNWSITDTNLELKTGFININKENVVKVHRQGNPTDGFNPVKINISIFNR